MKRLFKYIQQRLELRLGLMIVLIIMVVFIMLFDFLFYRCKQYVQHAAIDRAVQLLDNTVEHINGIMEETLRYGDEHLCTIGFSIYHSQRIRLQALALSWLKETLDEQMAAQMFALRKTVFLHFSISASSLSCRIYSAVSCR